MWGYGCMWYKEAFFQGRGCGTWDGGWVEGYAD